MFFPFSIKQTIRVPQPEAAITSEKYVLQQLEPSLQELGMSMSYLSEHQLFLRKRGILRTFDQAAVLRNLYLNFEADQTQLTITLETETILIFFIGLVFLLFPLFPAIGFPRSFSAHGVVAFGIWILLYGSKYLTLLQIKRMLLRCLSKIHEN